jgi:hypothetical protein
VEEALVQDDGPNGHWSVSLGNNQRRAEPMAITLPTHPMVSFSSSS